MLKVFLYQKEKKYKRKDKEYGRKEKGRSQRGEKH